MKKKLICLILALLCIVPLTLTGCKGGGGDESGTTVKPLTITLYGITGDDTTESAILAVQDAINEYTEGKYNTHVVLCLYPESEYESAVEGKLAETKRLKAEEEAAKKAAKKNKTKTKTTEETTAEETDAETYEDEYGVTKNVYPALKENQVDIFMVRGSTNLYKYHDAEYLSPLSDSVANASKVLNKYILPTVLATTTLEGTGTTDGLVTKGTIYGIPNNTVCGEYTYLLINKELAKSYSYSAADISTLATLQNYLDDVYTDHKDYITLYNTPVSNVEYFTDVPSLIGGIYTNSTTGYSRMVPRDMLNISSYTSYLQNIYNFKHAGYITEGDYYKMPVNDDGTPAKVAAAFIKGDASLPAQYEDEYFVVTYLKPFANSDDRPGTMFCVSAYTSNVDRCMQIITDLQTVKSLRDTFQYGVEGVHYNVNDDTGYFDLLNNPENKYSMNPADTGNMFIMTPNTSMSKEMLALAADDWKLGKQQNMDTIISPYAMFNFKVVTAENYKETSYIYASEYKKAVDAAKEEQGKEFDESKFEFDMNYKEMFTDELLAELVKLSEEYMAKIEAFEEYEDENGEVVTLKDYMKTLRKEFEADEYYKMLISTDNPDSPYSQYNNWYEEFGPKAEM